MISPSRKRRSDYQDEAPKTCLACGSLFYRKSFASQAEPRQVFLSRKFCSRNCAPNAPNPVTERLWRRVQIGSSEQCWNWTGITNERGYGKINIGRLPKRAHRVAWEVTHGSVPDRLLVCHKCDNRLCCNPSHLFLGTAKDNMTDMVTKGRQRKPKK